MQFEDQSAAMRQMKELLKDQAKFRAKLDRVVRKIETSSQRTAKLAERNRNRKPANPKGKQPADPHIAIEQQESEKIHGDKIHAFDHDGSDHETHEHHEEAISAPGSS
jgi:hypothetical protein